MSTQRVAVVGHNQFKQLSALGNLNYGFCNSVYKEENLGTINASNIASFVSEYNLSGQPKGIFPGMYLTIQDGTYNQVWMVADAGIQHNKGDSAMGYGIGLIPRNHGFAYGQVMNSSNTTSGGYVGSAMHTFLTETVAPALENVLGSHLLTQRCLLSNAVDTTKAAAYSGYTGVASGWAWTGVKAVLMSEPQVYGCSVWGSAYDVGEANQQLPVFRYISPVEFGRGAFWLRAVASSTFFALCYSRGGSDSTGASGAGLYVRPLIRLG